MNDLIKFLIAKITGSEDADVAESEAEGKTIYTIKANKDVVGLIIGKEGKTIKNLRRIASVRAVLENKSIHLSVIEK